MTVQMLLLRARSALDKADDVHQQHDPLLFVWLGEDLLDLWQQAGGRGPLQTGGLGAWRVWEGGLMRLRLQQVDKARRQFCGREAVR